MFIIKKIGAILSMRRILGNVGAFQLPNGKYAFGRIFKDSTVAF